MMEAYPTKRLHRIIFPMRSVARKKANAQNRAKKHGWQALLIATTDRRPYVLTAYCMGINDTVHSIHASSMVLKSQAKCKQGGKSHINTVS